MTTFFAVAGIVSGIVLVIGLCKAAGKSHPLSEESFADMENLVMSETTRKNRDAMRRVSEAKGKWKK